jgi:RNA polymerase II subunit A-like phosphatase
MPDDLADPQSPIDGLKTFDWGGVDDELAEFLGDDDDSEDDRDSDTDSVASGKAAIHFDCNFTDNSIGSSSHSHKSNISVRGGKKHPRPDVEEDDTDEESNLQKKQRMSRVRSTGLKTVKTPNSANSESSLPTPEITGGEEPEEVDQILTAGNEDDFDEDDFEAEMMAELEKDDDEDLQKPQDDDDG